tara:strand:+ start:461 stop:568 length:108 start_codon:yes stop_codon:yes gene_type:complete
MFALFLSTIGTIVIAVPVFTFIIAFAKYKKQERKK